MLSSVINIGKEVEKMCHGSIQQIPVRINITDNISKVYGTIPGKFRTVLVCIWRQVRQCCREGNGNPLQYSCLEYLVDRGAWWATVHGVAQSQTLLKPLSSSSSKIIKRLPRWLSGKESACSAGDVGLIPGSGRSPREGDGNPLQHSCLENPMDKGAWRATVHGVTKSRHD